MYVYSNVSQSERREINRRARIEGLKKLPVAALFTIFGVYTLSPSHREFALSVNFGPVSSLTPVLHFVMTVAVPALVLLIGFYLLYQALAPLIRGGSEADFELQNVLPKKLNIEQRSTLIKVIRRGGTLEALDILEKGLGSREEAVELFKKLKTKI